MKSQLSRLERLSARMSGLGMRGGHPGRELAPCYFILEELQQDTLLLLCMIVAHAVLLNHMLSG